MGSVLTQEDGCILFVIPIVCNFAYMMFYRLVIAVLFYLSIQPTGQAFAQSEIGTRSHDASSWSMLSVQKTWTNDTRKPVNWSMVVSAMQSVSQNHRLYAGFTFFAGGLARRDVIVIGFGPGYWVLGSSDLGVFTKIHAGLSMSSASGILGFDFFSDPTLKFGLGVMSAAGVNVRVYQNFAVHVAITHNLYTNEPYDPLGIRFGLSVGGPP